MELDRRPANNPLFRAKLASEFHGIRARTWNSERLLVYVAVILQTTPGVKRALVRGQVHCPRRRHRGGGAEQARPAPRPGQ
jgi:hypothetical protein